MSFEASGDKCQVCGAALFYSPGLTKKSELCCSGCARSFKATKEHRLIPEDAGRVRLMKQGKTIPERADIEDKYKEIPSSVSKPEEYPGAFWDTNKQLWKTSKERKEKDISKEVIIGPSNYSGVQDPPEIHSPYTSDEPAPGYRDPGFRLYGDFVNPLGGSNYCAICGTPLVGGGVCTKCVNPMQGVDPY